MQKVILQIFINGRFLAQTLTGVQRYALEMTRTIDRLLASGDAPRELLDADWQILTPPGTAQTIDLQRIKIRAVGHRSGHLWDQIDLARAARSGQLISLGNAGPILHKRQLVILHDAQVFRRPDLFSWKYLIVHRALGYLLSRTAMLGTVSNYSRKELAAVLHLSPSKIRVFPNSAEHFAATVPDVDFVERTGLQPKHYFMCLGTMTKNKNIALAIAAARQLDRADYPLVVVGGDNNSKVFQAGATANEKNIMFTGRLTDEQIAALFTQATAFVFPSLYEGFGVPPLEAMTFSCPVLASTADAVRETCGDAASYFDPLNVEDLKARMLERIDAGPISVGERERQQERLAIYSWKKSATALLQSLIEIQK